MPDNDKPTGSSNTDRGSQETTDGGQVKPRPPLPEIEPNPRIQGIVTETYHPDNAERKVISEIQKG